ncbi:MAG: hypothetical protein WA876_11285 [Candidatus Acidiferrales bacterium]
MASAAQFAVVQGRTKASRPAISPELKEWIRNVIVPILVKEYLVEHEGTLSLAPGRERVIETDASTASAERIGQ